MKRSWNGSKRERSPRPRPGTPGDRGSAIKARSCKESVPWETDSPAGRKDGDTPGAREVPGAPSEAHDPNRQAAIDELQKHIGTRVSLLLPTKGRAGQLILEFYDEEQLTGSMNG